MKSNNTFQDIVNKEIGRLKRFLEHWNKIKSNYKHLSYRQRIQIKNKMSNAWEK